MAALPVNVSASSVTELTRLVAAVRAEPGQAPVVFPCASPPSPALLAQLHAGLRAFPRTDVVVTTTGSTGHPRLVGLSAAALDAAAHATADFLGSPAPAWLLALPPHHVSGLLIVWRALATAVPLQCLEAPRFTADALAAALAAMPSPGVTSLVPTQLARILAHPAATAHLARLRAVLVGGAALPPALAQAATAAGITLVRTYGMTETAGGCVYNGRPLPGVQVAVVEGRLRLAGPMVAEGYLDDPSSPAFADGWHVTNDVGSVEQGRVTVLGRADDVIITGGENVHTTPVEAALTPLVGQACVVGVPDAEWGQKVVALVTVSPPPALRATLAAKLPAPWIPKHFLAVDSLPLVGPGKLDRAAARRVAAAILREQET